MREFLRTKMSTLGRGRRYRGLNTDDTDRSASLPGAGGRAAFSDRHRAPSLFCFLLETQSIQRESRESQSHCVPTEQHTHAGGAGRCEPLAAPPTRWRDRRSRVPRYFGFAIAATEGRYVSQVATSQHTRREERAGSVQRQTPKTCGARWNRSHTREALGDE